jgi:hypothetical protein
MEVVEFPTVSVEVDGQSPVILCCDGHADEIAVLTPSKSSLKADSSPIW